MILIVNDHYELFKEEQGLFLRFMMEKMKFRALGLVLFTSSKHIFKPLSYVISISVYGGLNHSSFLALLMRSGKNIFTKLLLF